MTASQINPADDCRAQQAGPEQEEEDFGPELDAEAILGADDLLVERHRAWGGHVFMWTLTGLELDQFDRYMANQIDPRTNDVPLEAHWRAALLVKCIRNKEGQPLFTEADIPALGKKSGAELDRLFAVARRMNKRTQREIEELKKASAAAQRGSSQPGSAEISEDGGPPANASES